ncbi:MAG TPA: RNA polymerase sigma factor [Candidatus Paceibacterota bacterium]|nr:RNA polymerase sigma factor [Candidatus Paceibacterota bacterium]
MNGADLQDVANIVERAKNGDREAFSFLYTAYYTPVYRYVYFRVSNTALAEDIAQDVFLKAYASFGRYRESSGSPQAYFYTIARNAVIDYYRKKKMPIATEEQMDEAIDQGDDPELEAIKAEQIETIRSEIAKLPQGEQDAITLRFIEGLENNEIAAIMGKSEEAVRQLQSRGLRAIKKSIEHEQ